MDTPTFFLFVFPFMGTVLAIFGMKYFSGSRLARARAADADGLRAVAEAAAASQASIAASLASAQAELGEVRTRLRSIEAMLKDVG